MAKKQPILIHYRKKLLTVLCIALSLASFATLGDGKPRNTPLGSMRLLSIKPQFANQGFTLRSGFTYKADRLLDEAPRPFQLPATTLTYQKGNTTYIIPLKKKPVLLEKVKFNPY